MIFTMEPLTYLLSPSMKEKYPWVYFKFGCTESYKIQNFHISVFYSAEVFSGISEEMKVLAFQ